VRDECCLERDDGVRLAHFVTDPDHEREITYAAAS
jgi:hypothetical protein